MKQEFYGIDLGTTYSCIAMIDSDDLVQPIPNPAGSMVTPSAVYFDDNNKILVGEPAKKHLADKAENTVVFIKREMSNKDYNVTINGNTYNPVQISSFILKYLVDFANEKRKNDEGKAPINDVVITVPAYFGNMERERTIEAGKMAGLNVIQLINEPTAASISYGRKMQADKNLLVYDLGGGTFDISILEFRGGIVNTKATCGDHHLGGVDWDTALAQLALSKLNISFDITQDDEKLTQDEKNKKYLILLEAEECKRSLTIAESGVMTFNYKGIQTVEISREEFETATHSLMTRTMMLLEQALDDAQMTKNDIDEIILVGGSSRMPMVKKAVEKKLGMDAKISDPDMAVAKGAALMASQATKGYTNGGIQFGTDKGTRAYGVKATDISSKRELCYNFIRRTDDLEIRREENDFTTQVNGQTSIDFCFYENESDELWKEIDPAEEIKGRGGEISWGRPVPAGTPVKVIVERDKSGRVRVFAECCGAKGEFEIVTPGCSSLAKQ